MAMFTVRVELHGATGSDYASLHQNMKQFGFTDTIVSDEGKTYQLPPAEYNAVGSFTKEQVLDAAKAAAARVKPSYAILVSESSARIWTGLALAT